MELWTAFLLGLVGSLHCVAMCGPLVLALPTVGHTGVSFAVGRAAYNFGRILTYGLLGVVLGALGRTLALAGVQRWVSLGAGVVVLGGWLASSRWARPSIATHFVGWLKAAFAQRLRRRSLAAMLTLGLLNGLLPCGLVYAASAGAVATGGFVSALSYMLVFGVGTLPMMISLGFVGRRFHDALRVYQPRLVPICLVLLGMLLIARGLSLGIPYLSPDLSGGASPCAFCKSPASGPDVSGNPPPR